MPASAIPAYGRYGEPAERERAVRLSLQRIEHLTACEGDHRVPHRHPFHCQVMYIEAGESECFVDGRVYRLRPLDLYALPAGVVHGCGANDTLRGWVLHCTPEMLGERPRDVLTTLRRANLGVDPESCDVVETWWRHFSREYARVRPGRGAAIRAMLRLLGVHVRRLGVAAERGGVPLADAERPRPVSVAFRELLDEQFARERNPPAYAAQLGITPAQLNLRVREETGAGPREHIDRRVILEAERLLAFTAITIGEVAARLGFDDPNYFWRYFRKHTGHTPGEWREGQRQEFAHAGAPGLELPFGGRE